MNLFYYISLHSKEDILPTILGPTPTFLGKKQQNRTNNLRPRKAGSVGFFSLKVGGQYIQKWCNKFVNAVAVNCILYFTRPPISFHVGKTLPQRKSRMASKYTKILFHSLPHFEAGPPLKKRGPSHEMMCGPVT